MKNDIFLHGDESVIMIKKIPQELKEKMSFHEICAALNQILGIDKKAIFSIKKYLPM